MSSAEEVVTAFIAAAAANMCATNGPMTPEAALGVLVEVVTRHAGGGAVAVPAGDPMIDALGVESTLRDAGCAVLRADDPAWRARISEVAVGVTGAAVAVAENGVVAVSCGPGSPRSTSLLPPVHVCIVRSSSVVETFSDAIARVGSGSLPSALSWIGGPSRTGDLGMTITIGVHGPKAVELIVVDL